MIRKMVLAGVAALACVLWLPAAAQAQSAIAGVVKDTSGAVLPGVTVEASSDVLIEKTRSVMTDGEGAYRIVDLRPGIYTVTFTLPGFQTFKREGARAARRTSRPPINADMKVGALEESVTVSGASPVVDVRPTRRRRCCRATCSTPCRARKTIQSLGQLVVGVSLSSPDVGGSRAMQQTYFAVHGVGASGTMVTVDGLITNGLMGDGAVQAYHNEAMIQEAVYQTAGGAAETITGGLNMNLVPKDGGNRFSGGVQVRQVAGELAGRQPDRRPEGTGRHRRRQDRQLLRVQRRAGRSDREGQAVVLRRVPPGALRQADRQHVHDARPACPFPQAYAQCAASRAPASRASRTRRWTTRSSASPGRCRRATSSRPTTTARCACAATR